MDDYVGWLYWGKCYYQIVVMFCECYLQWDWFVVVCDCFDLDWVFFNDYIWCVFGF